MYLKNCGHCDQCGKDLFTELDAKIILAMGRGKRPERKGKTEKRYYRCPAHKGKVHLTSK